MRNLGTQHCLTSDDDSNYRQKKKCNPKRKKRDEREFKCEEVFTRQYLVSSTHIVIYNIQVLERKKNEKEADTAKCQPKEKHLRLTFEDTARFTNSTNFVDQRSKKNVWVRFFLIDLTRQRKGL